MVVSSVLSIDATIVNAQNCIFIQKNLSARLILPFFIFISHWIVIAYLAHIFFTKKPGFPAHVFLHLISSNNRLHRQFHHHYHHQHHEKNVTKQTSSPPFQPPSQSNPIQDGNGSSFTGPRRTRTLHPPSRLPKQRLLHPPQFLLPQALHPSKITHFLSTPDPLLLCLLPLAHHTATTLDIVPEPEIDQCQLDVLDADCLFGFFLRDLVAFGREHA